jgi:hypothetical protein
VKGVDGKVPPGWEQAWEVKITGGILTRDGGGPEVSKLSEGKAQGGWDQSYGEQAVWGKAPKVSKPKGATACRERSLLEQTPVLNPRTAKNPRSSRSCPLGKPWGLPSSWGQPRWWLPERRNRQTQRYGGAHKVFHVCAEA